MATTAAGPAEHPFYIVDAFTRRRHRGNSAAVVILPAAADVADIADAALQSVAAEFNLSETAFVWLPAGSEKAQDAGAPLLRLRWFTPECEVPLCGHATLAAATAVLRHCGGDGGTRWDRLVFDTLSGHLPVARDAATGQWSLDFPLASVQAISVGERDATGQLLAAVLGSSLAAAILVLAHSPDRHKLLVELPACRRREFLALRPDFSAMLAAAPSGEHIRGVIVTLRDHGADAAAAADDAAEADIAADAVDAGCRSFDFLSRYFAPWLGIPEDPVTGAAHTVLAAYWAARLPGGGGGDGGQVRRRMLARQCSRRGGVVRLAMEAGGGGGRVELAGHSVVSAFGRVLV